MAETGERVTDRSCSEALGRSEPVTLRQSEEDDPARSVGEGRQRLADDRGSPPPAALTSIVGVSVPIQRSRATWSHTRTFRSPALSGDFPRWRTTHKTQCSTGRTASGPDLGARRLDRRVVNGDCVGHRKHRSTTRRGMASTTRLPLPDQRRPAHYTSPAESRQHPFNS